MVVIFSFITRATQRALEIPVQLFQLQKHIPSKAIVLLKIYFVERNALRIATISLDKGDFFDKKEKTTTLVAPTFSHPSAQPSARAQKSNPDLLPQVHRVLASI